jgi:HK97 family phage prohead protease
MSVAEKEAPAAADPSGRRTPTLSGHFAVFNQWTRIDSVSEGRFLERIAPGAFAKTIAENRGAMRVLFQHGRDPNIGEKPLGIPTVLREDEQGVYFEVPLFDTDYVRELLPALRAGAFGSSFRFRVVRESNDPAPARSLYNPEGLRERTIREARVMEFGPVTFPAYEGATAAARAYGLVLVPCAAEEVETTRPAARGEREPLPQLVTAACAVSSGVGRAGRPVAARLAPAR